MNENNINDNIKNEKTKNNNLLVGVIIGLLIGLLLGVIACTVCNKYFSDKETDNKDTAEKEKDNESNKKNEIEVIPDNDTEHEIITFDDISNLMSKDLTKAKSYKIQDVVYNNKKASIYIDYTFQYEKYDVMPNDKTTGDTKLVIKHGDEVLNTFETQEYNPKIVMTYLNVVDGKYLIYGDKTCLAFSNGNCSLNKSDGYNNIYLISPDNKESIENYHKDSSYFIYEINSDDNGITFKTFENKYGSGMWNCENTGDLQKVYNMKYSSGKFSNPELVSKVTYAEYCKNKDDSIFY